MVNTGERVCKRGESVPSGRTTGSTHYCQLSGCGGLRVTVRWDTSSTSPRVTERPCGTEGDSRITHPCSKGMERREGVWYIL